MNIGLFFGSFNPVHMGHMVIARSMVELIPLDRVWFVVSPQNPFKQRANLAHEQDRYDLIEAAVYDSYELSVTDIEFSMPKPSYTVDTLAYIDEKYPNHKFSLILGEDNLKSFHRWKNYQVILDNYEIYIYPRPGGSDEKWRETSNICFVDAPMIDISATIIRKLIREGKSLKYMVPESVEGLIRDKKLYL